MEDGTGLGAIIFDSYPAKRMILEMLIGGTMITICIITWIIFAKYSIFGVSVAGLMFIAIIFIFSFTLASPLSKNEDRFKIYERGVFLNIYKPPSDAPSRALRYGKWVGKCTYGFQEIISIHPFIYAIGIRISVSMGLRFVVTHPIHSRVAGDFLYADWNIHKIPDVVEKLKVQMGGLWNSKYKSNEPIFLAFCKPSDVARFVENDITLEELKAININNIKKAKTTKL
jgi:hypothetical protein